MELIILSFFAWILTILAPCVLPLLPVILWASASDAEQKSRPYIIIVSLAVSILVFTLLLKATTYFIGTPEEYLKIASGIIIIFFWIITLFPNVWKKISGKFSSKANENLAKSASKKWVKGSVLVGIALWPVFSSCSPTYGLILAQVLPISFFAWVTNLLAYIWGLSLVMLLVVVLGQRFISKMKWASDPNGLFKKILWVLFILIWLAIAFGIDKDIETYILEQWYYGAGSLEEKFLDDINIPE